MKLRLSVTAPNGMTKNLRITADATATVGDVAAGAHGRGHPWCARCEHYRRPQTEERRQPAAVDAGAQPAVLISGAEETGRGRRCGVCEEDEQAHDRRQHR